MTIPTTFDSSRLRGGIEGRDADALLGLYTDDATIEIVDANAPPSRPLVLEGREAIAAHLRDVYGREMTHEVAAVVGDEDGIGYTVRCAYPDGTRVLCSAVSELRDGRIARETVVQAWDA